MSADERVELETNVRYRRSRWWTLLLLAPAIAAALFIGRTVGVWFFLLPAPLVLFVTRRVRRAHVVASPEGIRIGERLHPRHEFRSGLVRHEGGSTFVALHGRRTIDVEVANNLAADALLHALRLDATSAAVEFPLTNREPALAQLAIVAVMVTTSVALLKTIPAPVSVFSVLAFDGLLFALIRLTRRVTLRVGADGLVLRNLLGREHFFAHDAISDVHADGPSIIIERTNGQPIALEVALKTRERTPAPPEDDEANAIVRRIHQARKAFREGSGAPELSVLLDRGSRSAREWLADLRRLGEGAASTFRTIGVAREQLFDVVESTTAAAKDRIAALVALRATRRDEDEPRIRIATERIAAGDLRERMVRVLEADDAELEEALEDLKADQAAGESSKRRT